MQRPWSVRQQLVLLILVIAIPGVALFAWLFAREWQHAQGHAFERARLLADGSASRLNAALQARERVLRRFAERPLVRALDPARCDPLVAEYISVHPEFTGLDLRDVAGNIVCAYRPNAPGAAQVAHLPWFQSALGRDGFGASPAFLGSRTGRWVSVLSQPIRDEAGKIVGLVLLAIDLLELQQRVIGALPDEAVVAVADANGTIVLRSRDPEAWLGKPAPLLHLALLRQGPQTKTEGVDGVRRLYAHATLPTLGWQVVAGLPEAAVLAQQRALLVRAFGLGLLVLSLILLLSWWIARSVVSPIRELAAVAQRIAGGDLQARAGLTGPAEVGAVAQQFNLMLDVRDRSDAERAHAEQALRDRERFTAALVSNLPGMVYRCLNDADRTMVFVSEGCKSVTGHERSQLEGNHEFSYSNLVHPDDREALWAKCQVALAAHRPCNNEYRIIARDGGVRWVWERAAGVYADDGTLLSIEGFVQDITERRRSTAALTQTQDKYRAIIESALDAVVQMNAAGQITGWNDRATAMFGWRASYAIGRELGATIIPERQREAHRMGMQRFLAGGAPKMLGRLIEIDALHRDGHEFPVELSVNILRSEGEVEFTAFIRDIGARKRDESRRLALEGQLRESQKMEAVGTLAGGIAHDFNNIMGAILGNVALARDDIGAGHSANAGLQQVQRAALRARSLVQQILVYSRRQPQELASRPLAPLVREGVALLRATLPAGVAIDVRLAAAPLYVMCDATQIQQVLMNLCTNAWHAMKGGVGRIEIGLEPLELEDPAYRPSGLKDGPAVHLWVSDDGHGMDEATRARIFEPFYTTKAIGQGTGLGLSVVHGIVTAHDGVIAVDSQPGRGSSFHIYLPSAPAADVGDATVPAVLEGTPGNGEHVLYIDDDEVVMLMVGRLLERAGFRVTAHHDPWVAVTAVHNNPAAFDIVVTDYNMPEFSGLDVARDLAALCPDLPVIISSGLVTETLRAQAQQIGIHAVMHKENSLEDLVPLVRQVLDSRSRKS